MNTTNLGDTPLTYHCALHSYFVVSNINQYELLGLSGQYSNKTCGYQMFDTPHPYRFTQETDRVHMQQPSNLIIIDEQIKSDMLSSGNDSIVVWNPWQEKSISMADMADDSYLTILCVETAVTKGQEIFPKTTHILEQVIT